MGMTTDEEKFFEELAKFGAASHEPDINVGFAKATSATIRKPSSYPKASEDRTIKRVSRENRAGEGLSSVVSAEEGQLTIDVFQTPDDIVVQSAIAGVKPEDIDIDVSPDSITIRGERYHEHEVNEEDYLYQECYWGRFSRSVILPQEVDAEQASVTFRNGVLTVRLPKVVRRRTKKLRVSAE